MGIKREDIIQNEGHARHVIENMGSPEIKENKRKYKHLAVASQAIKMVNSSIRDPFVRKVMTLRILGPAVTGRERSYISIALELGAHENDVKQAEKYGIELIEELMRKVALPDFIGKFNSERAVKTAVQTEMGKSAQPNPAN